MQFDRPKIENHLLTPESYKVIVKDFSGKTLSEEIGDLYQAADGTWWIA